MPEYDFKPSERARFNALSAKLHACHEYIATHGPELKKLRDRARQRFLRKAKEQGQ